MTTQKTLQFLTKDDEQLLDQHTQSLSYKAEQVVLKEGERRQAIFHIESGLCRVEKDHLGQGIAVAHLGPGEIFGEISYLEGGAATASVVTEEDATIRVLDGVYLQSLLESVPGLSSRFYRSLAVMLANRLKQTTRLVVAPFSWG